MAWMYYYKAFDRVSYSWIIRSLELIGIDNKILSFTKKTMSYWGQNRSLYAEEKLRQKIQKYNVTYFKVTHSRHCYCALA